MGRAVILRFLDDTASRRNWAHTGLHAAIGDLEVEEAVWRPLDGGHSVWEQINHIAHWKRYMLRRIEGRRPRAYQAWPRAGRTPGELRRATSELKTLHRDLGRAVARFHPGAFFEKKSSKYTLAQLLLGAAAHESYHTGQILLIRRLYRGHRRSSR